MIVRLSGVGQFHLADEALGTLNEIDNKAVAAVEAGDEQEFHARLEEMIALVHSSGRPVADDELSASDVVVPPADTSVEEARADFSGDGLIPD